MTSRPLTSDELRAAKSSSRLEMASARAEAAEADPDAGSRLAARFPNQLWPPEGTVVAGYWPFRSEIDSRPLMRRFEAKGCRLALPVTPSKGSSDPLSFRLWSGEALAPAGFGVHEPAPDGPSIDPDWMLVPLLAFDRFGGRLGYGAGHFDKTLAGLRERRTVFALGLAFSDQELAAVPSELHDEKLDAILTERAYMPAERED